MIPNSGKFFQIYDNDVSRFAWSLAGQVLNNNELFYLDILLVNDSQMFCMRKIMKDSLLDS